MRNILTLIILFCFAFIVSACEFDDPTSGDSSNSSASDTETSTPTPATTLTATFEIEESNNSSLTSTPTPPPTPVEVNLYAFVDGRVNQQIDPEDIILDGVSFHTEGGLEAITNGNGFTTLELSPGTYHINIEVPDEGITYTRFSPEIARYVNDGFYLVIGEDDGVNLELRDGDEIVYSQEVYGKEGVYDIPVPLNYNILTLPIAKDANWSIVSYQSYWEDGSWVNYMGTTDNTEDHPCGMDIGVQGGIPLYYNGTTGTIKSIKDDDQNGTGPYKGQIIIFKDDAPGWGDSWSHIQLDYGHFVVIPELKVGDPVVHGQLVGHVWYDGQEGGVYGRHGVHIGYPMVEGYGCIDPYNLDTKEGLWTLPNAPQPIIPR